MPASHWIGSTRKAHVSDVIAASSAARSPYGMSVKPGVNGPKSFRYAGSDEALTSVTVRPWKLPSQTMMFARSAAMPLRV